jgi:hypothetical protein
VIGLTRVWSLDVAVPTEYVKTSMQLSTKPVTAAQVVQTTLQGPGKPRRVTEVCSLACDRVTSRGNLISAFVNLPGFFGLYRGLSSMLYFAAPKAAIRFGSFEFFSKLLTDEKGG